MAKPAGTVQTAAPSLPTVKPPSPHRLVARPAVSSAGITPQLVRPPVADWRRNAKSRHPAAGQPGNGEWEGVPVRGGSSSPSISLPECQLSTGRGRLSRPGQRKDRAAARNAPAGLESRAPLPASPPRG